jgi:hypothetical protein
MMPIGVGIDTHIEIVLMWSNDYNFVQVASFELGIKIEKLPTFNFLQ